MSDRSAVLKTLSRDPKPERAPPAAVKPESEEADCVAFGYLRGVQSQSLHLQFRFRAGGFRSFPYSWLGPVSYHPSKGLVLTFVGDKTHQVTIDGRNLDAEVAEGMDLLNQGILRHRVVWIREMERAECNRLPEEALTVERITIEPGEEESPGERQKH